MYLYLGQDKVISFKEIIGIFDLDTSTVSKVTRDYLKKAETGGRVTNICTDLPKSFVVCEKNGRKDVYISQISSSTLLKRAGYIKELAKTQKNV